jgi:hypothetical protein
MIEAPGFGSASVAFLPVKRFYRDDMVFPV